MVRVKNRGQAVKYVSQSCITSCINYILLYYAYHWKMHAYGAAFTNNCRCRLAFSSSSSIYPYSTIYPPFCTSIAILKIFTDIIMIKEISSAKIGRVGTKTFQPKLVSFANFGLLRKFKIFLPKSVMQARPTLYRGTNFDVTGHRAIGRYIWLYRSAEVMIFQYLIRLNLISCFEEKSRYNLTVKKSSVTNLTNDWQFVKNFPY